MIFSSNFLNIWTLFCSRDAQWRRYIGRAGGK